MSVLIEFSMFPTDKGESVSAYVCRVIDYIDKSGISYRLSPMGTTFETETMNEALEILAGAYELLEKDCNRVYASVKLDIRKSPPGRLQSKIKSIENQLNREVQK